MFAQKKNWGSLEEIPAICIDRFGTMSEAKDVLWNKSKAFFLTHCDPVTMSDLLNGVLLSWAAHPYNPNPDRVYMHELSYRMLQYYSTTEYVVDGITKMHLLSQLLYLGRIVFVKPYDTIRLRFHVFTPGMQIPVVESEVNVTPMPAGSCPGSLMLLFEQMDLEVERSCTLRILYTGNCRLSLNDLKLMTPLFDDQGDVKQLDIVYLDTSHFNPETSELPSRRLAINSAFDLIESQRQTFGKDLQFAIGTPYEICDAVFVKELYYKYTQKIHVGGGLSLILQDPLFGMAEAFSTDDALSLFHFNCGRLETCYLPSYRMTCKLDLHCHVGLNEYKIHYLQSTDTFKWNSNKEAAYIRKKKDIACVYSANLSRYEAARMIAFLKVPMDKVKPLYIPNGMTIEQLTDLMNLTASQTMPEEPLDLQVDFPCFYFDYTRGPTPHQPFCSDPQCSCKSTLLL